MHGMHDKQGHLAASPFDNYLNLQVANPISWLPFLIHVICMHPLASHHKLSCLSSLTCITVTHFLSLHHHPTHDYTYQPIARLSHYTWLPKAPPNHPPICSDTMQAKPPCPGHYLYPFLLPITLLISQIHISITSPLTHFSSPFISLILSISPLIFLTSMLFR